MSNLVYSLGSNVFTLRILILAVIADTPDDQVPRLFPTSPITQQLATLVYVQYFRHCVNNESVMQFQKKRALLPQALQLRAM